MFDLILWACFISHIILYSWPVTWPQEWSQVVIDDHKAKSRVITMKLYVVRSHFESLFILYHYWPFMATHVTTRMVGSGHRWPQIKVSTYYYEVTYCSISFWKLIHFVWLLAIVTTHVTTEVVISGHKRQDKARAIILYFIIN